MAKNNSINSTDLSKFAATSVLANSSGSVAAASAVSFSTLRGALGIAGSTRVVYVRPGGVDGAPNDGSEGLPWASVGYAMTQITSATASNPYVINVAGRTTETNIALKPHVSIIGSNATLNVSGSISLDSTYLTSAAEASIACYAGLNLETISTISLDFSTAIAFAQKPFLYFSRIDRRGSLSLTLLGGVRIYAEISNCFALAKSVSTSALTITNVSVAHVYNCALDNLTITCSSGAGATARVSATTVTGTMLVQTTGATPFNLTVRGCSIAAWTLDGLFANANIDLYTSAPTLLNGATFSRVTDVGSIKGTSNGGVVWSDASKLNILSGTATANLPLLSGASGSPSWSTISYPTSATANAIVYASSATALGTIATANNSVLVTDGSGVPSLSTTLPTGLAMQTPASISLTNGTGLPLSTGVTGTLQVGNTPTGAANVVYVASNGNDTTGNGSVLFPYATVSKAMTVITTATSGNPYYISMSGNISDTSVALKPNVSILGNGNTLSISGTLSLDSSALTVASFQMYKDLYLNIAGGSFSIDYTGGGAFASRTKFINVDTKVALTFTFTGASSDQIYFDNCFNSLPTSTSIIVQNPAAGRAFATSVQNFTTRNTTSAFKRFEIIGCMIYGSLTHQATSTGLSLLLIRGVPNLTSWTLDGTNTATDVDLYVNAPTLLNSATLGRSSNIGALKSTVTNGLVYGNATNLAQLATAANGTLVTDGSGVPSISSTLTAAVQNNITAVNSASNTLAINGTTKTFTAAAGNIVSTVGATAWVPGLAFGGATTGIAYTTQTGFYSMQTMPDGSIFTQAWGVIALSSKGTATGVVTITGLPTQAGANAANYYSDIAQESVNSGAGSSLAAVPVASTTTAHIYSHNNNNTRTQMTNTQFSNTSSVRFYLAYWNN